MSLSLEVLKISLVRICLPKKAFEQDYDLTSRAAVFPKGGCLQLSKAVYPASLWTSQIVWHAADGKRSVLHPEEFIVLPCKPQQKMWEAFRKQKMETKVNSLLCLTAAHEKQKPRLAVPVVMQ